MGRKENPFIWYFDQNINFAELADGWLFHGEGRICCENLVSVDRRMLIRHKRKTYREHYRDLYKLAYGMEFRLFIGVGHQSHVHYAMPVRVMDYDSAAYTAQQNALQASHGEARDLKEDEFLSGFSRTDRLMPVITLVLYIGDKPWDGAVRLHDLLDFSKVPDELKTYIADYPIHVLDVCHTPDERLSEFPPDVYTFFLFIKYKNDPEKLQAALSDTSPVRGITCEAIADCVGERRLKRFIPEKKGEKVHMCKAIDLLIADGEKRGIEIGEKRGVARAQKNIERAWKRAEHERKNAERERIRAEKAEALVRELEEKLKV